MYFDYNATVPLRLNAKRAMEASFDLLGNPTSIHRYGRDVRGKIEKVRALIAENFETTPKNVIFTSGATEANVMIISQHKGPVFVSEMEHDSVFSVRNDCQITPVTSQGYIDLEALENLLKSSKGPALVCVLAAHNETGVIQPIQEVIQLAIRYGALTHIDATQSFSKTGQDYKGATTISISAHKIGGPSGIGALIKADDYHPTALIKGGGQERGFRSGTENVLGILGFGGALEEAFHDDLLAMEEKRNRFEKELLEISPEAIIFGKEAKRLPNTTNFAIPQVKSEIILMHFDQLGIAVSSGSACSSGKVKSSRTLLAMGFPDHIVRGSIRVSLGYATTDEEIDALVKAWSDVYLKIKSPYLFAMSQGAFS